MEMCISYTRIAVSPEIGDSKSKIHPIMLILRER